MCMKYIALQYIRIIGTTYIDTTGNANQTMQSADIIGSANP